MGAARGGVRVPANVADQGAPIVGATPQTPQVWGLVPIPLGVYLYAIGGLTCRFVNFYVTIRLNFTSHSTQIPLNFWPAQIGCAH